MRMLSYFTLSNFILASLIFLFVARLNSVGYDFHSINRIVDAGIKYGYTPDSGIEPLAFFYGRTAKSVFGENWLAYTGALQYLLNIFLIKKISRIHNFGGRLAIALGCMYYTCIFAWAREFGQFFQAVSTTLLLLFYLYGRNLFILLAILSNISFIATLICVFKNSLKYFGRINFYVYFLMTLVAVAFIPVTEYVITHFPLLQIYTAHLVQKASDDSFSLTQLQRPMWTLILLYLTNLNLRRIKSPCTHNLFYVIGVCRMGVLINLAMSFNYIIAGRLSSPMFSLEVFMVIFLAARRSYIAMFLTFVVMFLYGTKYMDLL